MKRIENLRGLGLGLAVLLSSAGTAHAAVTEEEASALGKNLTPFGAEAGANADGSIPAYKGGMKAPPASYKAGAARYTDPFAGSKPLHSITAENVGTYAPMLSEGTLAMLKKLPGYRVDVYSTERTMAYPEWFLANTKKNATTAKVTGEVEGDKVSGAAPDGYPFQGVPFPIPKTGYEVMWNALFRFAPPVSMMRSKNYFIDTAGQVNNLPGFDAGYFHPWSEETGTLRKQAYNGYFGFSTLLTSPPTQAGTHFLNYYQPDAASDTPIWFYTPGQRRVRKAPEFAYDIPMTAYAGVLFWDEPWAFVGRMDRFDMKLVGKKEMIVPYNVFGITNEKGSEALGKQFISPDAVRWEKRRVWVVEATRKKDARHAYSKRKFFIEEDCWCFVGAETYDDTGSLWRVTQGYMFPAYDVGGGMNGDTFVTYDMLKGNYLVINTDRNVEGNFVRHYKSPEGLNIKMSPQAIAAGSVR